MAVPINLPGPTTIAFRVLGIDVAVCESVPLGLVARALAVARAFVVIAFEIC
jgi:hypothetical protein